MASNYFAKGLKQSALTIALGMCFVGGVQAQTNTGGNVVGSAAAGDTITITSPSTGFSRTITAGADGNFRFAQLPSGQYQISQNGGAPRTVNVNVGTSANVDFAGAATTLDTVTVTATSGAVNPIDVSSVESTTILTAEQVAKIPVPRNITSVALLAPGTVRGAANAGFGALPSFGGSSVAENQFYVNGFNITNTFKNLAFAQVPFEGIAESQVKTGGYGAEFGRSTGGVINMITKRGTNEFKAGGSIYYIPESLSETSPDLYYNNGLWVSNNSNDNGWEATAAIWAGGALIKDKLFAYGLIQYGKTASETYTSRFGNTNLDSSSKRPQWLAKVDWQISDDHSVELTAFSDKREFTDDYYRASFPDSTTNPTTGAITVGANPTTVFGDYRGTDFNEAGGSSWVLKYTGYLTDNFTLSALYGHGEFSRSNYGVAANGQVQEYTGNLTGPVAGCPIISDSRAGVSTGAVPAIRGCSFINTLGRRDALDERDQWRIDAEWQLGDHLLRFGIDNDKFRSVDGSAYSGGANYVYQSCNATAATCGPNGFRTRYRSFRSGANVGVDQQAYYIEDSWSMTDNFVAYLGLRWDTFENLNGEGEKYVTIKNQFAPRLGFSWDVFGDSTFKVFGNAGRYALPLTAGVATRAASASLYEERYYSYTGVDPATGTPTGLTPIVNPSTGSSAVRYLNGEDGRPKFAAGYAVQNLKPMYQDEFILGMQKQLTDNFSLGVRAIHRDLGAAIDDNCDYATLFEYVEGNGPGTKFNYCFLFNPGEDAEILADWNGDGTATVKTIPGADLSPKAKRKYTALEFFVQGNWDKFFLQGSYTWAKSIGNTEGGVRSDNGQADTGTTSDFDYAAAMIGAYGYTPNDRRHSLKLFGNWDITDQWSLGANLLVQSGRPISCIGVYQGLDVSHYGNIHFSCDPGAPDGTGNNGSTIIGRGTVGRTPWTTNLDLNVAYKPSWAEGLQFKVDVFNVLNSTKVISVNEIGEDASGNPGPVANTYLTPTAWQSPRQVRFLVQYDF
ncbi:MAG TPA: TonB-dependent receptor [Thermomonas sp.]|jgi:hypothetical protein|uniref:TonB-dependent receptor n=1 Tax=Thermomonas sp. TaxID=1971895 RepID=UPI002BDFC815|nr:TonB-dependent receptor [Thermomonas sp.]HPW12317.1 TonB-dependent receptor [Thermomonas sp.]